MPKGTKQPVKKRAYKKKANLLSKEKTDFTNTDSSGWLPLPEINAIKKDTEIQELAAVVSIFDNWTEDQKTRIIRFLASKYWEYLKDSTII